MTPRRDPTSPSCAKWLLAFPRRNAAFLFAAGSVTGCCVFFAVGSVTGCCVFVFAVGSVTGCCPFFAVGSVTECCPFFAKMFFRSSLVDFYFLCFFLMWRRSCLMRVRCGRSTMWSRFFLRVLISKLVFFGLLGAPLGANFGVLGPPWATILRVWGYPWADLVRSCCQRPPVPFSIAPF